MNDSTNNAAAHKYWSRQGLVMTQAVVDSFGPGRWSPAKPVAFTLAHRANKHINFQCLHGVSLADNVIYNMQDAGIALLESMNADIYNNAFNSVKFGIRLSLGSSDNYVHENTFEDVSTREHKYRFGIGRLIGPPQGLCYDR